MKIKIKFAVSCFAFASVIAFAFVTAAGRARAAEITFNKEIAPIIFASCAECHHAGGPAPFSLMTYQEVKKRARQIAVVTASRYMPPWLPEPGHGEFLGARRLSDDQIKAIRQWVEQGAAEGSPSDLPPAPRFNEGWQLGRPDLVVKMAEPYTLAASGADVFRNFVIHVPVSSTRYVRAVEILPGNKRIVHHANILIDRTRSSRRLDAADAEPGFGGMDVAVESDSFDPESHFLFWKPGTPPYTEPEDMAWRLDAGTDLVLNMHLQPSGKPETIQPLIGIYFTDKPPARWPMLLQMEHDGAINIPPGKRDFSVADDLTLPLDVDVLGVYPHAHYLGKEVQAFATLPDGTKRWLIYIKDWDINWQAVYRYASPVFLPKGTAISMRITYDNSASNARNPSSPPRRVVAGDKSTDEMGHLWLQVLPRTGDDRRLILQEALMRRRLRKYPADFTAHFNLGAALQSMGRLEEAIAHFRLSLAARPDDAAARNNLGTALQSTGKLEEAVAHFNRALQIRPDYTNARYNLGNALLALGRAEDAASQFREVLAVQPDDAGAHNGLGSALATGGNLYEAARHFEQAILADPKYTDAHYNLGKVFALRGKLPQAIIHFEQAIRLDPKNADAHNDLGIVFAIQGKLVDAAYQFEQALKIDPYHADARRNLARARAQIRKD
jgi:Flp pilus assembly protein TadD/cytochrome c553